MKTKTKEKEQTERETSKGICAFCETEIDKSKMTQHLKFCKQRIASQKAANTEDAEKLKLFHIVVEGQYLPMYWMHLEVPADATLLDLDDFLRAIWVECCEHLSGFKIGDTFYSSEPPGLYFVEPGREVEEEREEGEEEIDPNAPVDVEELLGDFPEALERLPSDLLSELKKPRSVDDLVVFLKEQLKSMPKDGGYRTPEEFEEWRNRYFQRTTLKWLLDMVEDRSLGVPLGKVLKVGQKFFYEYDFGSTTHLALRVAAQREGAMMKDEDGDPDPFFIMARNEPPIIPCRVCGKPATKIASGYYSAWDGALCDTCAKDKKNLREYEDEYSFLPVVNSPRVGVCGYTGESEGEWVEEEWDEDEEYEEDEDEDEE